MEGIFIDIVLTDEKKTMPLIQVSTNTIFVSDTVFTIKNSQMQYQSVSPINQLYSTSIAVKYRLIMLRKQFVR